MLNPYDLYRKVPNEEQPKPGKDNNLTHEELMKRPGLCLAKTHPWLRWRKDAYRIYQDTRTLASWLNQEDTKTAIHVSSSEHNITWEDCNGKFNW